jgi:acetyl-CoA carboxylase carboxyl transferase subunit alpha
MFEHAYYSVITPEGCAAILWRSADHAPQAAKALRCTSRDLKKLNLVDEVLPEPLGGGHREPGAMMSAFERYVVDTLRELKHVRVDTLLRRRYERLRQWGSFFTSPSAKPSRSRGKTRTAGQAKAKAAAGSDAGDSATAGNGRLAATRTTARKTRQARVSEDTPAT